jgi:Amt family ammonium transporter
MKDFIGRVSGWHLAGLTAVAMTAVVLCSDIGCSTLMADEPPLSEAEFGAATKVPMVALKDSENYTFNTIVMFICAVLVLFMQAGFAMLEVGMNAAKNTINILFKNVMDLSVGVLLFFFIGFGLMYPGDGSKGEWFGFGGSGVSDDLAAVAYDKYREKPDDYVNIAGDPLTGTYEEYEKQWREESDDKQNARIVAPPGDYSNYADFLFQVAFAATAATIVSGAVAGRMQFKSYLVYSAILTGFIYPISGMWKWGGGWLDAMGFQDFAGSVVVHAVGGFAGLAGAIVLGPRIGRFMRGKSVAMPGHNITFAALGVLILWIGWYGFNPGSQLNYAGIGNAGLTAYIAMTTTLSAAAGAVAAMIIGWVLFKKPDVTMALNGALAGLVGITANCDAVSANAALIIGLVAGLLVVLGIMFLDKLSIDDPVGAWPVHGLCGIWGGLATGIFVESNSFVTQLIGTAVICAWAFFTMLILFAILKAMGILRVSAEEETRGLDISEHGMHAYPQSQLMEDHVSPVGT